jgi:hypothetical protein
MLLKESIVNQPIFEEKDGSKLPEAVLCRVTYPVCNIGERNANKRVYEKEVWDNVLGDTTLKEMMDQRRLFGHAEHPAETQSDLQLTSHVIHNMWIDEATNKVMQSIDVLDTPMGRIVDSLLRANCLVGMSTRAEGDLEESEDDEGTFSRVIPESYRYITTDFTADPSTFGALPQDAKHNVVSSITTEMKNETAAPEERTFARKLLESMECNKDEENHKCGNCGRCDALKEKKGGTTPCAKSEGEERTIASLIDDGLLRECTGVKRGDLEGSLTVSEGMIQIVMDGKPIDLSGVEVASVYPDGTIHVWAKEDGMEEPMVVPAPEEETMMAEEPVVATDPVELEEEPIVPVESTDEKKVEEGDDDVDKTVARIEHLEAKVEAGKGTPEIQAELEQLKKDVTDAGGEIPEGKVPVEGGHSEKLAKGNLLKKGDEDWLVSKVEDNGIYVHPVGKFEKEQLIVWDDLPQGFVKVSESQEINEAPLSTADVKKLFKSIDPVFARHLTGMYGTRKKVAMAGQDVGLELSDEGKEALEEGKDLPTEESVNAMVREMTDLKIKEAIERAEREVAIEAYQEMLVSTKISETKVKMLIKKVVTEREKHEKALAEHKEKYTAGDVEVKAMRSKLEEKAKAAAEAEQALASIKESIEQEKQSLTESISEKVEEQKALVEKHSAEISEAKEKGVKEGRKEGARTVVLEYVACKLAELGISVGENTRALLDECTTLREVDDTLEKVTDVMRRSALHSGTVKEIRLDTPPADPEQSKIESDVNKAFEGM